MTTTTTNDRQPMTVDNQQWAMMLDTTMDDGRTFRQSMVNDRHMMMVNSRLVRCLMVDSRCSDGRWQMDNARMVSTWIVNSRHSMLGCSTVDCRPLDGWHSDARMLDSQQLMLGWLTVDAQMLDGRHSDGQCSTLRWSMLNTWMVNARHSDGQCLMLGWSTTDGQMTTNDDRPMMMDTHRVHHEANTNDLALWCVLMVALVNFLFYFPWSKQPWINLNIILWDCINWHHVTILSNLILSPFAMGNLSDLDLEDSLSFIRWKNVTSVTTITLCFFTQLIMCGITCGWTLNLCTIFVTWSNLIVFSVGQTLKYFHGSCHKK